MYKFRRALRRLVLSKAFGMALWLPAGALVIPVVVVIIVVGLPILFAYGWVLGLFDAADCVFGDHRAMTEANQMTQTRTKGAT